LDISNIDEIDSQHSQEIFYRLNQLFESVEANNQSKLEMLLDMENVTKVEAIRAVMGDEHDYTGDNLLMYYDTTTGKFGFLARSEGTLIPLENGIEGINESITTFHNTPNILLRFVLRNNKLRHMRNEEIWQLVAEKQEIKDQYEELEGKYKSAFLNDNTNPMRSSVVAYYLSLPKQALAENLETLQEMFEYNSCSVNLVEGGKEIVLEITPDSLTAIRFSKLAIKLGKQINGEVEVSVFDWEGKLASKQKLKIESQWLQLAEQINKNILQKGLDENMRPEETVFKYKITLPEAAEIALVEAVAENAITGKPLHEDELQITFEGTSLKGVIE